MTLTIFAGILLGLIVFSVLASLAWKAFADFMRALKDHREVMRILAYDDEPAKDRLFAKTFGLWGPNPTPYDPDITEALAHLKASHDGIAVDQIDPTDDMPHTVTGFAISRHTSPREFMQSMQAMDPRDQQAIEDLMVEADLERAGNEAELVDFNLYRRAREAAKAAKREREIAHVVFEDMPLSAFEGSDEDEMLKRMFEDQEIEVWIMPPGGATEEQVRAVGRIIDAEGEKS